MANVSMSDLSELARWLDQRSAELEKELLLVKALRSLVMNRIGAPGFAASLPSEAAQEQMQVKVQPQIQVQSPAQEQEQEQEQAVGSLKSAGGDFLERYEISDKRSGKLLGVATMYEDKIEIAPKVAIKRVPPFTSFLEERVLGEMRKKDEALVDSGVLGPEYVTDWTVETAGDIVRKLIVRGIDRDEKTRTNRIREIISAFRWTAEKMLEKEAAKASPALG